MAFRSRPLSGRSLSKPVRGFDLDEELARLREETEWREGRRNAIKLHKGGGLSVVLLAMRAGDRLEEHSEPGTDLAGGPRGPHPLHDGGQSYRSRTGEGAHVRCQGTT